jgi:hypothetical protein
MGTTVGATRPRVLPAPPSSAARATPTPPGRPDPSPRSSRAPQAELSLRPGWPLVIFFALFPLWWLVGLAYLGAILSGGACLAWWLAARRRIEVRGARLWLLFLLWVLAGATVLWVQAPGAAPTEGLGRLLPWALAVVYYLAFTGAFLYVARHDRVVLPDLRLERALSWFFLTCVAGAYVGLAVPQLELRSLLEVVLPSALSGIDFLATLLGPGVAQEMDIGVEVTRPSAPFVYANDWGAHYGLLAPFFVLAWTGPDAGWRRRWFPLVALVSLPPAVFTLNRGLWLGLVAVVVYLAVRLAFQGNVRGVVALALAAVLALGAVATTPLGDLVTTRLDNPHSNDGRSELATRTVQAVVEGSPVVGFGSTREVSGSFGSISGGRSSICPKCSPPNFGTQGHLWSIVFRQGLVGAAFFLGFVLVRLFSAFRLHGRRPVALTCVVVFYVCVMPVYDLMSTASLVLAVTLAMLWRLEQPSEEDRR